jgi:TonB family protein
MSARQMFQQPEIRRRSPLAAVLSLLVHGAVSVAITGLAYMQVTRPAVKREQTLTFLRATVPTMPVEVIEPLRDTPPLEAPKPEPPPEPEAIVELPPPEPEPEPVAPKPIEPPAPKRPAVKVGEFAAAPAPAPKVDSRQVQTVGFEMQQAVAPDLKMKLTEVGAFESRDVKDKDARLGSDRPAAAVVASGFESTQALTAGRRAPAVVASGGFGSTTAAPKAAVREAVKPVGFGDAQPAATTAQRQKVEQAITPVEVTFKPQPAYSDEARAMKIEGEVTLEVEFAATGQVRVRRVVRGLGHGLDEMATRAAQQIRFKPAQSGGTPVDFTATVQIVFRLS